LSTCTAEAGLVLAPTPVACRGTAGLQVEVCMCEGSHASGQTRPAQVCLLWSWPGACPASACPLACLNQGTQHVMQWPDHHDLHVPSSKLPLANLEGRSWSRLAGIPLLIPEEPPLVALPCGDGACTQAVDRGRRLPDGAWAPGVLTMAWLLLPVLRAWWQAVHLSAGLGVSSMRQLLPWTAYYRPARSEPGLKPCSHEVMRHKVAAHQRRILGSRNSLAAASRV
jgi:hypothetical protein